MKQTSEQKYNEVSGNVWMVSDEAFKKFASYFEQVKPPKLSWIERLYKWLKRS